MQTVLTSLADRAARTSGFVQRTSKLGGAGFAQTLVFGFLANPQATRAQLAATAAGVGITISAQGLDQRMSETGAACLGAVLEAAAQSVFCAGPVAIALLERFSGVFIQDSTTIGLPHRLAQTWLGSGNHTTRERQASAVKLGVRLNLSDGRLSGPHLDHGLSSDRRLALQSEPIPEGALHLADLGFFDLSVLQRISHEHGLWLSRLLIGTAVVSTSGERLDLLAWLERQAAPVVDGAVRLGVRHQLAGRLLAVRVPQEVADQRRRRLRAEAKRRGRMVSALQLALAAWTLLITNVPPERLSVEEALVLVRARWQIELLFRLWKSQAKIDTWRSGRPWAILCELYAKLIGVIVQHWLILVSCWNDPDRSLTKASAVIRQHSQALATAWSQPERLVEAIAKLVCCVQASCRINKRRTTPHTYQLLLAVAEAALP